MKKTQTYFYTGIFAAFFLLCVLPAGKAWASSVSWTGNGGDGKWETASNWSGNAAPGPADDVTIATATTVSLNASTTVNSLILGVSANNVAAILNFNYDAVGSGALAIINNLTVYGTAVVTHTAGTASVVGKIDINVGGSATIAGSINADSKGYSSMNGGGGGINISNIGTGGSYGGIGGSASTTYAGGAAYGSITNPTDLGSGGGIASGGTGGSGGGAVVLNVSATTTITGAISANGGLPGSCWIDGGGSGGSIYITTLNLAGNGTVSANGGAGCDNGSGAGGGGRIAVYYTANSSTLTYNNYSNTQSRNNYYGGAGTTLTKSAAEIYGDLLLNNQNNGSTAYLTFGRSAISSSTWDSLTVKNSAWLYLSAGSIASSSSITLSNNGLYDAATSTGFLYSALTWSGAMVRNSGGSFALFSQNQDLTVPAGSYFIENVPGETRTYNNLTINGTLTTSQNTAASTSTPTSSLYKLIWNVSGNLAINSGGSINVDGDGYSAANGPGAGSSSGSYAGGGGYGGLGGSTNSGPYPPGPTYGSSTNPTDLGSGGGLGGDSSATGGSGGGAVILNVTATTTVAGTISANGAAANNCWYNGGGSGGSINITTANLAGSGTVSANGGNGCSGDAGGGGGRIAINISTSNTANLTRNYAGGTASGGGAAGNTGTFSPTDFAAASTQAPTNIAAVTAVGNGTVTSLGYLPIIHYGHVWSLWANPAVDATTTVGGTASASSGTAANAFDSNLSTTWSPSSLPADLEYDISTSTAATMYSITARSASGNTDSPSAWTFMGWNGSSWITLDTENNQGSWSNSEDRQFFLSNLIGYTKYKIHITANNGGLSNGLAEFTVYGFSTVGGGADIVGSANATGPYSATMAGLSPDTGYHYRAYVTNKAGTSYGSDTAFTTDDPEVITQGDYRFYQNINALQPATPLASQDATDTIFATSSQLRLRMNLAPTAYTMNPGTLSFNLQVSTSTAGSWTDVTTASNWWNMSWLHRRKIYFNNASSTTDLADLPVLVSLSAAGGNINYSETKTAGADIRFVASDDQTALPYQIEKWDISATSTVWVQAPVVQASSTSNYVYMYYDNPAASDAQQASGVWDSSFDMVQHLPDGSTLTANDSTSNGVNASGIAATAAGGLIDGAANFNGSSGYINFGSGSGFLEPTTTLTVSAWVNPNSASQNSNARIVDQDYSAPRTSPYVSYALGPNNPGSANNYEFELSTINNADSAVYSGVTPAAGTWAYIVGTYDGSTQKIYINGVLKAQASVSGNIKYSNGNFVLGGNGAFGELFNGLVDEVRISNIARSPDWVLAEYKSGQNNYNTYGAEESQTSWKFYDNPSVSSSAAVSSLLLSSSSIAGNYQETQPMAANPDSVPTNEFVEYDFPLDPSAISLGSYYFRMVDFDDTVFSQYNNYPTVQFQLENAPSPPPSGNNNNQSSAPVNSGGGLPPVYFQKPYGAFGISINNGAAVTGSRLVTLSLLPGTNGTQMALSNSPGFDGVGINPFQNNMPNWDLCRGVKVCQNGQYKVYAKFYTFSGQVTPVYQGSIMLQAAATLPSADNNPNRSPALPVPGPVQTVLAPVTVNLKLGDVGIQVRRLQAILAKLGYLHHVVTGNFASLTLSAVKSFQTSRNLKPTGLADLPTRTFLNQTAGK